MVRAGPLLILGIDCAIDPRNQGVCRALMQHGRLEVREVKEQMSAPQLARQIKAWLLELPRALIALDAPLGWPVPLADELAHHRAGESLSVAANPLFRRRTDDVVAARLNTRPLDVGADRIARTAHAALELLRELRWETRLEIPLAFSPGPPARTAALEVYPAATLKAHGLPASGYKGAGNEEIRAALVEALGAHMALPDAVRFELSRSDPLLDAAVCCLAAADFVRGNVIAPEDLGRARREGWIWVRAPDR